MGHAKQSIIDRHAFARVKITPRAIDNHESSFIKSKWTPFAVLWLPKSLPGPAY